MRVFVTGVNGQLGYDVMRELIKRGHEAIGSGSTAEYCGIQNSAVISDRYCKLDITDADSVMQNIVAIHPDAVVHCSAWTAVDAAEDEANAASVRNLNYGGTENIARACRAIDAKMIYISTDYVFNGQGEEPWKPDCRSYEPLNIYGQTKLEGELAVAAVLDKYYIVRTSWVFGTNGRNFVKTMLGLGKSHDEIRVVNDQIGRPTYTPDLARLLVDMAESEKYGYYHVSNEGEYISWYDFTREIFRQAGISARVTPVTTAEYGMSKAGRPYNSRLDTGKILENGFMQLPDWKFAISDYLEKIDAKSDE